MKLSQFCRCFAAALVFGFWVLATSAVTPAAAQATAQSTERLEGTLTVVWGDPGPGATGGGIRFTLTLPDGTAYPLRVGAAQRSIAIRNYGKPVVVQGQRIADARGRRTIAVTRVMPGVQGLSPALAPAIGLKRTLFILLRYSGDTQQPHIPQFYSDLTNPTVPVTGSGIPATINGFFNATSWGQLQWQADVAGLEGLNPKTWLTLPFARSHYLACPSSVGPPVYCIAADGMAEAVRHGVDVSAYDSINFVLNNDIDCCSWGGSFLYNNKVYHGTWEAPWGQDASYYAHELGHALGLPHSGWVYYSYDSPWDVMSMHSAVGQTECGRYLSANNGGKPTTLYCYAPGDGYIAPHKDYLGWISAAHQVVMSAPGTQTITLSANAWSLGRTIKLVKICLAGQDCTGAKARYITVEARIHKKAYEKGEPGDGVLIQGFQADRAAIGGGCFFNNQSGWVVPIDATPGDYDSSKCSGGARRWPAYGLGNALYKVGQTYSNRTY
ncbi:MAG TPA: hypothetical protein VGG69_09740, partial [Rhizomicrobium sp.]